MLASNDRRIFTGIDGKVGKAIFIDLVEEDQKPDFNPDQKPGFSWWAILIIVFAVVLLVLITLIIIFYLYKSKQSLEEPIVHPIETPPQISSPISEQSTVRSVVSNSN
ncbi:MAG: hypothetical protein EZS28_011769 [Streblomastix strix]|uniref:Uncharacterized protein n=1 Tax=Streblomastix strix TaxID=222440 RepID=A0A5J4WCY1_9EUKA|nr:MAG: hypothetical protein EZS28_011769 [Streblomastix strix]